MQNVYLNNQPSFKQYSHDVQQRMASDESFGAVDREKLKQDAVEISNKAKENAKENFVFKTLHSFGVQDPKKFLISTGLTILTIVTGATLGNKSVNKMADLGIKTDDLIAKLKKNNKFVGGLSSAISKAKNGFSKLIHKSKTYNDVVDTMKKRKLKPKVQLAKGMGQGFSTQFAFTNSDVVKASSLKNQAGNLAVLKGYTKTLFHPTGKNTAIKIIEEAVENPEMALEHLMKYCKDENVAKMLIANIKKQSDNFSEQVEKLVGKKNVNEYFNIFMKSEGVDDAIAFSNKLTKDIVENLTGKAFKDCSKEEIKDVLLALKRGSYKGKDLSAFTSINMNREGIVGSWWPANIIDKIGKKIKGDDFQFARGNLGDALLKYNIASGKLADTKLGSLVQKSILIPAESITNFVCDFAGMNLIILQMLNSLYTTAQDAPKGQKAATIADDFVGGIGSLAISTPLAFATTYGLASLKNLEGKTLTSKLLKQTGKVFGMGLGKGKHNILARFGGGALRFCLSMFVFSGLFSKPVYSVIHKVFGKPYDKAKEEQKKQLEAQMQQVIPEFGITQAQLMEKMQKNPQAVQRLQTDAKLAQAINNNPKLLIDLLDGKEINYEQKAPKDSSKLISPANQRIINNSANLNSNTTNKTKTPNKTNIIHDSATYIPSSEVSSNARQSTMSNEQQTEYNSIMAKSDRMLKEASKYV